MTSDEEITKNIIWVLCTESVKMGEELTVSSS